MTSEGSSIDRLRDYLQALSPQARIMLVAELERALLRDGDDAASQLVLQELRRIIRGAPQQVPRIGDAARRFFMPIEPYLIESAADHKRIGRLARVSLGPIWDWIRRDLMPSEAMDLSEAINRALVAGEIARVEQLTHALQDGAVQRMREVVAGLAVNEKARRRFPVEVGTPRAIEDVTALMHILASREPLAEMARRLPDHIHAFERDQVEHVKAVLDSALAQKPPNGAAKGPDALLYALILVTSRLAAPWQLIRLATRAAETDDAARIAGSSYAAAVTLVLGDLEYLVGELRTELKAGRPVASLLKTFHDAARGLRTEIDLSADSRWSRQLAAIRGAAANLLTGEIEAAPGRVRRLLRPRPASEIVPGSLVDALDVHEVEAKVEVVAACRHYAGELAVSEVTARGYSELTQYLETGTRTLLDALRHAEDAERPFRQSQVEAAVRFCRAVFGADYAGHLAKAADAAVHAVGGERKQARA